MSFTERTVEVDGCSLALRRGGRGEALLYLHGTDGLVDWPPMLDSLAARYEVIAPDHPGYGSSPAPDWLDDIGDLAYFYFDVIDRLGISGVHVVGHSVGGWIGLEMAVRCVHRLRSLTLIASAGIHVKGVPKTDIFMIDPDEQARLAYADTAKGEAAAARAAADKYQDSMIMNRLASARLGWHPRFFNPKLERWLHRVRLPTHIVWGAQDRIIPPAYGEAFHRLIPGSTLTTISDAGHLPHLERPDATLAAIEKFMAGLKEVQPS
jgi:pimeloyl-ACP methyl ester carboxylesterase